VTVILQMAPQSTTSTHCCKHYTDGWPARGGTCT